MLLIDEIINSPIYTNEWANETLEFHGRAIDNPTYFVKTANGGQMPYQSYKFRVSLYHTFQAVIIDPENPKKTLRKTVRYCENSESIFMDEQDASATPTKPIVKDGIFYVDADNHKLKLFMLLHPQVSWSEEHRKSLGYAETYSSTTKELTYYNHEGETKKAANDRRKVGIASSIVWAGANGKTLKALTAALGFNVQNMTEDSMRLALDTRVNTSPESIIEMYKNPDLEKVAVLTQAFSTGVLTLEAGGIVRFKTTDILEVPSKTNKVEAVISWTKTNEKGSRVYNDIADAVNIDFTLATSKSDKIGGVAEMSEITATELFEAAKEAKAIKWEGMKFHYDGEVLGKSSVDVIEKIDSNSDLRKKLMLEVKKV